ncbi:hypothetical protein [Caldimonas brevitalea]|uniref:Uncharacterized protein n=1 Tax=Caldimonas brevitalea TaxID=413882 RepID=A0A0G3BN63_9BURK|nr:hypothetical protein [Caldimonas brevitalea]AKJ28786.1 hypothetical protein AAW51_2095 [Caldimonas brevitalea]
MKKRSAHARQADATPTSSREDQARIDSREPAMSTTAAIKRAAALDDAVTAIVRGQDITSCWEVLFEAAGIVAQLCARGIAEDRDQMLEDLNGVFGAVRARRAPGVAALYPAEVALLRDFVADYATVLSGTTEQQFLGAKTRTHMKVLVTAARMRRRS